ncbi:MAG: hypothetical protein KF884_03765 [Fimbriimonadaceae bacterium]|nr:hypothetical protein [Fimbriimonadaceae bacterium]QYK59207.1 MAG: hypothetical protein KF884_03765 [Fimbriimonadaceae bacterium]
MDWTGVFHLLAQDQFFRTEFTPAELLSIGLIPTIVGLLLFVFFLKLEYKGSSKYLKWAALAPLVIGVVLAMPAWQSFYGDPLYQELYGGGRRDQMLHSLGVVLPILGAVVLGIWGILWDRQKVDEI